VPRSPTPNEWRQLGPLLDAALDATPDRRAALLTELSGGDAARRGELERLVAECENEYPLLERPASERFAALFGDEALPMPESLTDRYRIIRELGRGGMAIVYVARDLKHGRDVAVKVVRPELAAALGRGRFLREIEIAARLRHPHIVPLYDSGESNGVLYYVMPYEAGHSLRERVARDGPLPLEDVVHILRDVCDALAHAHQHGIVHRDIKPDNVLLSGRHAMVADFGVARAVTEATIEAPFAGGGTAVGTPGYMAPEQVTSDPHVDHRADIYAVGVLAYELLAGRPPFADDEPQRVLSAQLNEAPPSVTSLRPDVPEALAALVMKCLAQGAADRWQSANELLAQLESVAALTGESTPAATRPRRRVTRSVAALTLTVGAVLLVALVIAIAIVIARNRVTPPALLLGRASQLTSEPGLEVQPSLSPDGRYVAYAAGHSLQMHILVRPVAGGRPIRLTNDTTENAWFPRWSRDGTRILFLSRGGVFSAPALGGPSRPEIVSRPGTMVTSATWSPDMRQIAFVRGDSLQALTVATGNLRLITTGGDLHSCSWSPNGARLACVSGNHFYVTIGTTFGVGPMFGNLAPSRIVLVPAAGGAPVSLTDSGSLHQSPAWSPDGRTLYYVSNRQGQRDVYALDVGGRVPAGGEPVRITTGLGAQAIGFSTNGSQIVYAVYRSSANAWSVPIPANPPGSSASAVPVTSGNQTVEGVRVSPDGRFLVYDSDLHGNSDVYRVPLDGGEPEQLTRGPLDKFRGAISPDGKELTYHSFQTGSRNMFLMPLDGGPPQQLTFSTGHLSMANWSPDGTALALFDMKTSDVLVMRRDGRGRWGAPRFVARNGWRPEWSPDGGAIAFVSPADGRIGVVPADSGSQRDVYVPGSGGPRAELAVFATNGRELYFKSHDARGYASFWSLPAAGGRPRLLVLFDDPTRPSNRFDFASDGKRFYFTIEDRQSDIWVADVARR
jgi:Tol biopolymer transport system component